MTSKVNTVSEMQSLRKNLKGSIGFVPTMGALHAGHMELLKKSRKENEIVVLSVFVNPTQFNSADDFEKYPQNLPSDFAMAQQCDVDFFFCPKADDLYPDDRSIKVIESNLSTQFCGAFRPGHFDGVLTIVLKLLNLVRPDKAYFGEKDFQQLQLVQKMVDAFFLATEIVPVPTVRESSGLAMSSRNERLSPNGREKAAEIYRALRTQSSAELTRSFLQDNGFQVEYVADFAERRLVAAWLDGVRLIDNISISELVGTTALAEVQNDLGS